MRTTPITIRGIVRLWPVMLLFIFSFILPASALPPVIRSTFYPGTNGSGIVYAYQPWMNSNVAMTVEAWVFRTDSTRTETIISQQQSTNFWFGFGAAKLRFYR